MLHTFPAIRLCPNVVGLPDYCVKILILHWLRRSERHFILNWLYFLNADNIGMRLQSPLKGINFICMYHWLEKGGGGDNRKDVSKIPTIKLCLHLAVSCLFITTLLACVYSNCTFRRTVGAPTNDRWLLQVEAYLLGGVDSKADETVDW